eukprot:14597-Chlamydomonas_euryale.AAC.2
MIKSETGIEVGRVQSFYNVRLPHSGTLGEGPTDHNEHMYLASVKWFATTPAHGANHSAIGCPSVKRTIYNDPDGNYWELGSIIPTKLGLAPHLTNRNLWQVVHTDSDFMKRDSWR